MKSCKWLDPPICYGKYNGAEIGGATCDGCEQYEGFEDGVEKQLDLEIKEDNNGKD